jgi:hypothetical protein
MLFGFALPILLLLSSATPPVQWLTCLLARVSAPWLERARVRAPQLLPLS